MSSSTSSLYKPKIILDQGTLEILYRKYKDYLISVTIIIVSFLLFLWVIMPQIQEIMQLKNEESVVKKRIDQLSKNKEYLTTLDESRLSSQFLLATKVLPPEKDFVGILSAISFASVKSNVKVADYTFNVGNLSTKPGKVGLKPSLNINLMLMGDINRTNDFLKELSKSIPISDVVTFRNGSNSTMISIVFYYQPNPPSIYNYNEPIKSLLPDEQATLDKVSSWTAPNKEEAATNSAF